MTGKAHTQRSNDDNRVEAAFERHKKGDLEMAAEVYRRVLAVNPDHSRALHYLGLIAQQTGHSQHAASLLQRSIELDPNDPRTHNHLGQVQVALNDRQAALTCFEQALRVDPQHVDSLNNLANMLKARDLLRAIALYRRAYELNPRAAFAVYNLANALCEDNAFDEALTLYERVIEIDPRHFHARHSLGVLLEQKGRIAEAIEQYFEVRRIGLRYVPSLANLIAIRNFEPDAQIVADAEEMLNAAEITDGDRSKLHHGLGKYYDRTGHYERAFGHFADCKAIMKRGAPNFDARGLEKDIGRTIQAFSLQAFATLSGLGSDSQRPVFIVGMPRSGTTLTEQILASHPRIFGAGELPDIPKIVKSLRPEFPECVATMDQAALASLADDYLAVIGHRAGSDAVRVTDKRPMNFMHLGFIATLFPRARIIYCRRDPLDIGLSCFIELLGLERDCTTDLHNFGQFFLQHERLMAHWRATLPIPIYDLRYEDMVADPEAASRALVAHCGLEWEPACLEFRKSERMVRTPGGWEVRQPIYCSSVGRWRHYAAQMEPLVRLLETSGYRYERALC